MAIFISESELQELGGDVAAVVTKANSFIRDLQEQIETISAQKDATEITAEQNCALLEQKYMSRTSQYQQSEAEKSQLAAALEKRAAEVAESQSHVHKLELSLIRKDSDIERLSVEVRELHRSKRELLDIIEQKGTEITEKNSTIKSYLDKIIALTDERSNLEAKLRENEGEINRSRSSQTRLEQEKELLEKHNSWLNQELTSKMNAIMQQHQSGAQLEAELSSKLTEAENKLTQAAESLKWHKQRLKDSDDRLSLTQQELQSIKADASVKEEQLSAELATASKLADLYKQSSEEWSHKANELEGVIKSVEIHLNQVEEDYSLKLKNEVSAKEELVKETSLLKEKLDKLQADYEKCRSEKDSDILAEARFSNNSLIEFSSSNLDDAIELHGDGALVPKMPSGISATALAASLLRDGWSLVKIYSKYQEAVDAFRHEKQARKQTEAILERVLHEIEEKAEMILDERAEHTRMVEAYSVMEEKLQQSLVDQTNIGNSLMETKAELRKKEREYNIAQKEIRELQQEVTVLLKESRDIQLQYTAGESLSNNQSTDIVLFEHGEIAMDKLTFKDIRELVQQNYQLRHNMNSQGHREEELKEAFERELQSRTKDASSKVNLILKKSEEQTALIESLQGSLAMYKRLYEEEIRNRAFFEYNPNSSRGETNGDIRKLLEICQEATQKVKEDATEHIRCLEEDIKSARNEVHSLRAERDRLILDADYARERLTSFVKESENQRNEMNNVLARNAEFSHLVTEYQRRLRETYQHTQAAEQNAQKLSVEVSVLEREKEILSNAEKRASEEVESLSKKVHQLQATLDTIQSVEEIRESTRLEERKRLEENQNRVQREWAEAKQELQTERERVRNLTLEKEQTVKEAMLKVESISRQLAGALQSVASSEARATAAEARCSELQATLKRVEEKAHRKTAGSNSIDEEILDLEKYREEVEQLKEELLAANDHRDQYKLIAQANEDALQQMESANRHFKSEIERMKKTLEDEVSTLNQRVSELESELLRREVSMASERQEKENTINRLSNELMAITDERNLKIRQLEEAQNCIAILKEDLEKEHQNWRAAQNNYERQVLLQAETIQELTKTSQALSSLQEEASELRNSSNTLKDVNESSKVSWEMEKASIQSEKHEAEKKLREINEQNKILLDRLEAMHIRQAETERSEIGIGIHDPAGERHGDKDLQPVIQYLRRSKEAADTEISLLRQERSRLQKEVQNAIQSAEMAQSALLKERESARSIVYTNEELKSLQLQVAEINLLRESNTQLREENRRTFEDSQNLGKKYKHAQMETERILMLLREKDIEIDAARKEVEMQKSESGRWQNRVSEVLEKYKSIDVVDYENVKAELQQLKERTCSMDAELESHRKLLSEKEKRLNNYEQDFLSKEANLVELEKKLQESSGTETALRADLEKYKRHATIFKRKFDESNREKQSLLKQNEDTKSSGGKKAVSDLSKQQEASIRQEMQLQHEQSVKDSEQKLKEKDARIQILEKTLEREREENQKYKATRQKEKKDMADAVQRSKNEKKKYEEAYEKIKSAQGNTQEVEEVYVSITGDTPVIVEGIAAGGNEETSNVTSSFSGPVTNAVSILSERANQVTTAIPSSVAPSVFTAPPTLATTVASSRQISKQTGSTPLQQHASPSVRTGSDIIALNKGTEDKDAKGISSKQVADERSRKTGRRFIRPRIEPTSQQDSTIAETETCEMETDVVEETKYAVATETESHAGNATTFSVAASDTVPTAMTTAVVSVVPALPIIRKRLASSSVPDMPEESCEPEAKVHTSPLHKKARGSNAANEKSEQTCPSEQMNPVSMFDSQEHGKSIDNFPDDTSKEEIHDDPEGSVKASEMEKPLDLPKQENKPSTSNAADMTQHDSAETIQSDLPEETGHDKGKEGESLQEVSDMVESEDMPLVKENAPKEADVEGATNDENFAVVSTEICYDSTTKSSMELAVSEHAITSIVEAEPEPEPEPEPHQASIGKSFDNVGSKESSQELHLTDTEDGEIPAEIGETDSILNVNASFRDPDSSAADEEKRDVPMDEDTMVEADDIIEPDSQPSQLDQDDQQNNPETTEQQSLSPARNILKTTAGEDKGKGVAETGDESLQSKGTTINLSDRARENRRDRTKRFAVLTPASRGGATPPPARAGTPPMRGGTPTVRGVRGGRSIIRRGGRGRGNVPDDSKGQ